MKRNRKAYHDVVNRNRGELVEDSDTTGILQDWKHDYDEIVRYMRISDFLLALPRRLGVLSVAIGVMCWTLLVIIVSGLMYVIFHESNATVVALLLMMSSLIGLPILFLEMPKILKKRISKRLVTDYGRFVLDSIGNDFHSHYRGHTSGNGHTADILAIFSDMTSILGVTVSMRQLDTIVDNSQYSDNANRL